MSGQVSVEKWMEGLGESTKRTHRWHLESFLKWVSEREGPLRGMGPDQLIELQKANRDYAILDEIQSYVNGLKTRHGSKKTAYAALRSFFASNRAELPKDPRFTIRSDREPVNGDLTPEQIKKILDGSNPMYRAIFLSMFQGALDLSGFEHWNLKGWPELREQLDRGDRIVKIMLPGRKKRRNVLAFYTLIGPDAVDAVNQYLPERPLNGSAIFYNKDGDPIKKNAVRLYWLRHLERMGLIKRAMGEGPSARSRRYGKNLHELRDVFRSQWTMTEAKPSVGEFMMGHDVDKSFYDKAYRNVDWVKDEYKKALPMLQIWSKVSPFGYADRGEVERLQAELERAKSGQSSEMKAMEAHIKSLEASMEMRLEQLEAADFWLDYDDKKFQVIREGKLGKVQIINPSGKEWIIVPKETEEKPEG